MFRTKENVPEIYVNESRDFQLLCNLYDLTYNGIRFDIRTMLNCLNSHKINNNMLELFCSRVGFFPRYNYPSNILRYIISSFPYIMKNKGNKRGIEQAVLCILNADGITEIPTVIIENGNIDKTLEFSIRILIATKNYNEEALLDLLSYIAPIGYKVILEEAQPGKEYSSEVKGKVILEYLKNPSISTSQIRDSGRKFNGGGYFDLHSEIEDKSISSISGSQIIGESNAATAVNAAGVTQYEAGRDKIDADKSGYIKVSDIISNEEIDFVKTKRIDD